RVRRAAAVIIVTILTLSGLSGLTAQSASAATIPAVGVQFHATWSDYTDAQRIAVLDKFAAAHISWVRIDMGWAAIQETGRGQISQWYVDLIDRTVASASARGIKVLGTLLDTPGWANGNRGHSTPPDDLGDYAWVANWMATRFRGKVAAWEVWNEPNLTSFWANADPVKYAALVRAAYPAFKSGDPNAQVLIGAVSQNDTAWLGRMYDAGVSGSYDVLSTHPYQGPADGAPEMPDDGNYWILDHIGAVHALMVARGDGAKKIWATEYGWSSHTNTGTEPAWKKGVTEAQQGDYFVRSINWFAQRHPYVTNVFWYNDRQKATGDPQEDGYGLLRRDLSDKPAYTAIKSFLSGATQTTTTAPAPTTTTTAPAPTTSTTAPSTTTTTVASGDPSTTTTVPPSADTSTSTRKGKGGYKVVGSNGKTYAFTGLATSALPTDVPVAFGETVVGAATANSTGGSWVATDRGAVFATNGAPPLGRLTSGLNQPIVGIAARPAGDGYWLVARDGGIFAFGRAPFLGSTGAIHLNQPIVGMASTPTGKGYWLVAQDGGIFAFGDARFFGSTGAMRLNKPVVGMASTLRGDGYWLVASDGGVFSFGTARFLGSTGAIKLNQPIVAMATTPSGSGYWFAARDGGVFAFGDAPFQGSATDLDVPAAALATSR
ncbi:MAG: polysaccharide biosynthesis protein PslG, partial [Actinomycetota bacterium]|nr:polysaccharide biosynthesis protein PslG [Actinomycetota bacterium]